MQVHVNSDGLLFDASHYQGPINFVALKSTKPDIVGAYFKASEGTTYTDPNFATYVKGAKAVGLKVGAYHFAQPTQDSAVAEAQHFSNVVKAVSPDMGDLLPVLDLETPSSGTTGAFLEQWVKEFDAELFRLTGCHIMLYTGNWFIEKYGLSGLSQFHLWDSYYSNSAPTNVGGWTVWTMWQFTDKGTIAGISGNVDEDWVSNINSILNHPSAQQVVKKTIFLPASNDSWTVFKLNHPCSKSNPANIAGQLAPKRFGGLTYDILGITYPDCYLIQTTAFGEVQIYGAQSTGAVIKEVNIPVPKPVAPKVVTPPPKATQLVVSPPTPQPKPAPKPQQQPVQQPTTTTITVNKADVTEVINDGTQAVSFLGKMLVILKRIFHVN